jgi:hypothetical protein
MQRIFALFITLALATTSLAAVPQTLSYSGALSDASGNPPSGSHSITFALYDAEVDGNLLWSEIQSLDIMQGAFSAVLGSVNPLNLPFDQQYWLGVQVGSDPEMPRTQLTSSPYSLNAAAAEKLGDSVLLDGSGRMRIVAAGNGAALQAETPGSGSIYLRGNTQGQAPHHDALLKLEASSDYRGRGMLLTHRKTDDQTNNAWFVGVPYQGGQFQIGNSSIHAENTNGGAYTREAAKLTIAENGEVGVANALTVGGTTQTTSFKMPTNAVSGHVLTVDADGVGTWQAPGAVGSGQIADGSVTGDKLASDLIYNSSVTISASVANGHALTVKNDVAGDGKGESGILIELGESITSRDNDFLTFQRSNGEVAGRIEGFSVENALGDQSADLLPPTPVFFSPTEFRDYVAAKGLRMPEMFGIDLDELISQLDRPLGNVPITVGGWTVNIPDVDDVVIQDATTPSITITSPGNLADVPKISFSTTNLFGTTVVSGISVGTKSLPLPSITVPSKSMSLPNIPIPNPGPIIIPAVDINLPLAQLNNIPVEQLQSLVPEELQVILNSSAINWQADRLNIPNPEFVRYVKGMGADIPKSPTDALLFVLETMYAIMSADGGVVYETGAGDFAEWLPRLNANEQLRFGQIVGVRGGKISKHTAGADDYMVVSLAPALLGNMPEKDKEHLYEKVAFIGQVPVWIRGAISEGDYIIPSGDDDGTGIAVSPDSMCAADFARVVGRAWQASARAGLKLINTAIGMESDGWVKFTAKHQQQMQAIAQENDSMQNELTALAQQNTSLHAELQTLQAQVTQLEAIEARLARFESTLARFEALGLMSEGSIEVQTVAKP